MQPPIHPFRNARDANAIPPATAAKDAPPFHYAAPVQQDHVVENVFEKLMGSARVNLSVSELLCVAPEMRQSIRQLCTARKVPHSAEEKEKKSTRTTLEVVEDEGEPTVSYRLPTPQELREAQEEGQQGILALPYDVYEANVVRDNEDGKLEVAPESGSLRTVLAIVDNKMEVECILDPGCQIVAMSEAVAMHLGVSWDPRVVLRMQSANGQVNPSLGLAHNVPFQFANVTIYLQVHIIREAAYDVLLGRPFDDITRSIISNRKGGQQTITLHCPNSKIVATIPTFPRGKALSRYKDASF